MDGKTAVQPRFIWLIKFGTAIAIILWAANGWAQDYEKKVDFTRLIEQHLTPRSEPATVTTEEESALAGKGYVKIGTIGGSLPGTDAKTMKDQILAKAADAGGDLVRLDQDGVSVQLSLSKDKEKRTNCLNWETSTYTTTEKSKEVCYKDEHGYSHCLGGNNYEARHTRRTCTRWDYKTVTSLKTVPGLSSEGTVWRRDPNLADDVALKERKKTMCSQFVETMNSGDLAGLRALLDTKPDLVSIKCDAVDSFGYHLQESPGLKIAIIRRDIEMVKLFLGHSADVNAKDNEGETPLHIAAEKGYKGVAELLLTYNASIYANANKGIDPELLRAAEAEGYKPVTRVAPDADVNAKDNEGDTPLHKAAYYGQNDVAELLIAHNADVNAKNTYSNTPLLFAVLHDHEKVAELLIAHNADVNAKNTDGNTPLLLLFSLPMAELLIAHNADVNAKNDAGETPLGVAQHNGFEDVAKLLLAHGAHK